MFVGHLVFIEKFVFLVCRGRGSRALLKWVKQGVVVHDASYYTAVQLEGPEAGIYFFFPILNF